jgi:poly-gamma-glutamate capsule biosynthesis protein CapA/YwtB (metallophosphatase superfamily)
VILLLLSLRLAFVGDIMLGSDWGGLTPPPDSGRALFSEAKPFLDSADIAVGNLEGPLTTSSACTKKTVKGKSYAFRMPPYLALSLKDAGFDVLNTANNHANDFGEEGKRQTIATLDSLGLKHTGFTGDIAYLETESLTVAVIGFGHSPGCNDIRDIPKAKALVAKADSAADIVVVTFHGGAEGPSALHVRGETETFYGENRGNVLVFARACVEAGADLVVGHGPHVPRAMEIYQGRLIAYSLGNFCTWNGINVSGLGGLAPMLLVEVDSTGKFIRGRVVSFTQQKAHYPQIDPGREAFKLMRDLTLEDLAGGGLIFGEDGEFYEKPPGPAR